MGSRRTRRLTRVIRADRLVAVVFLALGASAAVVGAYYYLLFASLLDPLSHSFPLLFEAGILLYGGLMGLQGVNLTLWAELNGNPAIRALVLGPLAEFGGASRAAQDYYFLVLFVATLLTVLYRFGSVSRVAQLGALSMLPLPMLIYAFDRIEFNTFFASVAYRVGLQWFTNALLLYLSLVVFGLATAYPFLRRLALRAARQARAPGP